MICCDNYVCFEIVGKGGSSIVFRSYNRNSKEEIAIKVINSEKMSQLRLSHFYNEIAILNSLSHPNIVNLIDFSESKVFVNQKEEKLDLTFLALDFCKNGDLFLYITRSGIFSEPTARYLFHQLIDALEYIHENNAFHRDIKPENLMFDSDLTLKMVDFGFVPQNETSSNRVGTPGYMLPEMHRKEPYRSENADLFSAAVVLFNMMTQHPPFQAA